ncbi:MAG: hypothetical protein ACRENP_14680 [Longimicrobiales bacterium]
MSPHPPRMAEWLLERVLPRTDFADGVVGDLREEYALRGLRPGAHVRAWYWGQALSLIIRLVSFGCGLVPRILFCALARRAGGGS